MRDWFLTNAIDVMEWPSVSPDLNPIENLWVLLVRRVYSGFRQFDDQKSLLEAIEIAWDSITLDELRTLADFMPPRLVRVLEAKGGPTKYRFSINCG